jgi:hypothetical protein
MSMRIVPVSLRAMRGLVVVAMAFAAVSAYASPNYRYRSFCAGAALGVLLVLAAALFRAHAAEVESAPPDTSANQE